jgi:hypothetical protein
LFHLKNRLKTRVALIELLDLSGIAVGNVGVPTCLVNIEFRERQKADFEPSSHFVKILLVVCQNCLNQLDVNKQSFIRAHWHNLKRIPLTPCPLSGDRVNLVGGPGPIQGESTPNPSLTRALILC